MPYKKKVDKSTWQVQTVEMAKNIAQKYMADIEISQGFVFGLPEVEDMISGVCQFVPITIIRKLEKSY